MANMVAERTKVSAPALANPAPLGLSAFALTTFVLSTFNAGLLLTGEPIVLGLALFYGGLTQFCAGMWEFKTGNTFGATAFSSYGAFWIAFGVLIFPFFGKAPDGTYISLATIANSGQAVGLFLLGWTIFTGMMLLVTFKISGAHVLLFLSLFLTFLFLTIGKLNDMADMGKYGGWLGLITACIAWYIALAQVLAATDSPLRLPTWPIGG
jgi:uncharacterized protein